MQKSHAYTCTPSRTNPPTRLSMLEPGKGKDPIPIPLHRPKADKRITRPGRRFPFPRKCANCSGAIKGGNSPKARLPVTMTLSRPASRGVCPALTPIHYGVAFTLTPVILLTQNKYPPFLGYGEKLNHRDDTALFPWSPVPHEVFQISWVRKIRSIRLAPKGYRTIKTPELPVLRPGPHQGLARGRLQSLLRTLVRHGILNILQLVDSVPTTGSRVRERMTSHARHLQ